MGNEATPFDLPAGGVYNQGTERPHLQSAEECGQRSGSATHHRQEWIVSHMAGFSSRPPVPPEEVKVESIGVNPLDRRRVDVAVDLTPCSKALTVEMVIVGPDDKELCSVVLIDNTQWMLDKVMHLRQDAQAGDYVLHVGAFYDNALVTSGSRTFVFSSEDM